MKSFRFHVRAMNKVVRSRVAIIFLLPLLLVGFVIVASAAPTQATSLPGGFSETVFATGLDSATSMDIAPDGRIFVTQQGGDLRVVQSGGGLLAAPFLHLDVDSNGERGLLGVTFDPDFASNNFIYIYYTVPGSPSHNRLSRFVANGDVVQDNSETVLLDLNDLSDHTNHNGGGIHFGSDGKLYVGVGENADAANARTLDNLLGKILRLNADGSIPSDNPFNATAVGVNQAIWAKGLRNPYTFAFQPGTGRLFINDVGEGSKEEINDGIAGSDYGWRICEGPCSPPNASYRDPLHWYAHSGGTTLTNGCAIVGGSFYNPATAQFPAGYVGDYFYSDLCNGWIRRFDPAANTDDLFISGISNPVDIDVGADGSLYYLARGAGRVMRVTYNPPAATNTPTPTPTNTPVPGGGGSGGSGLLADYFDNKDLTNLKLSRTDKTVNFDWGSNAPDPSLGADTFSVRWTGMVQPQFSETYTFTTSSDDGVRLWVNNQLLINDWVDQPLTSKSGTIALTAGQKVPIKLEYYDNLYGAGVHLSWQSPHQANQIIPASQLFPGASAPNPATATPTPTTAPGGGGGGGGMTGLRGDYFDNKDLTNLKLTRLDPTVNFDWGSKAPNAALGADTFSVRWTGFVQPQYSETYTFITNSDDGVRLWVNNQLLINDWVDQPLTYKSGTIALTAGQKVQIKLEYYDNLYGAAVHLYWQSAHQAKQIIPAGRLSPQ